VENGTVKKRESLTGLETIFFNNFPELEAFYTHGGISTLPETMTDVHELDYKTVRYKGHAQKIMLLKQLGFFDETVRSTTENVLEKSFSKGVRDVVLARITSDEETQELIDHYDERHNISAMARTTGFPTAVIAGMVLNGDMEAGAFPPEHAVDYGMFVEELEKRGLSWRRFPSD
jgi:lysine 6-dehydrogenase